MKKIVSCLLSAVTLFGTCIFNGNIAKATEGRDSEEAAAARVVKAAAPAVSARDTEIVLLVDASRSMRRLKPTTLESFNRVIREQKREIGHGRAFVTTVMFNGRYTKLHDRQDLQTVRAITAADYVLNAGTAMRDAIGKTIVDLSRQNEVAGHKVVFVVITDGWDTASRRFSKERIRELIREKKADGWEFMFFGANIDVEEEGDSLGFDEGESVPYEPSDEGYSRAYDHISSMVSESRRG